MKRRLFWELNYNDGFAARNAWFDDKEETEDFIESLPYCPGYTVIAHGYTNGAKIDLAKQLVEETRWKQEHKI